jgi:hypothetical protein
MVIGTILLRVNGGRQKGASCRRTPSGHEFRAVSCQIQKHRSLHSITAVAIASIAGGIVKPGILAVLRLITKSNLVDISTGISTGFSSLRIRPVFAGLVAGLPLIGVEQCVRCGSGPTSRVVETGIVSPQGRDTASTSPAFPSDCQAIFVEREK